MSSSDYTDEDSPRWPQVPQAHTDWVKADQSGGCWLRLVLRSPISCAARQKWQWLNQSVLAILGSFSTITSTMQHYMANTKHSGMREKWKHITSQTLLLRSTSRRKYLSKAAVKTSSFIGSSRAQPACSRFSMWTWNFATNVNAHDHWPG